VRAHILTIGAEILAGDILDTNFRELARALGEAGIDVAAHHTVADDVEAIAALVGASLLTADVVVVTGGLGPTPDDLTREGVARALGVGLTLREDLLEVLETRYRAFGRTSMPEVNRRQVTLPAGAEGVPNPHGTAPGFRVQHGGSVLFALPGVPHEMRHMVADSVLPWLRAHHDLPVRAYRVVRTMGIGESDIVERLGSVPDGWRGVGIAFYPRTPGVDLKLTHHGKDSRRIERELDAAEADLRRVLARFVFATGTTDLPEVIGGMLVERGWRLAVAESCTGGALAALITSVAGASRYFDRGVVAYANRAKVELLGVPQATLDAHGSVSEETARAMAEGLRERAGVEVAVATTGIAGPDGGTQEKPVGLVYTAVTAPDGTRAWESRSPGSRDIIIRRTAFTALHRLRLVLTGEA